MATATAAKPRKAKAPYTPSPEAESCLSECWVANAPLPTTGTREGCLEALDKLHAKFGLSWDRIRRI